MKILKKTILFSCLVLLVCLEKTSFAYTVNTRANIQQALLLSESIAPTILSWNIQPFRSYILSNARYFTPRGYLLFRNAIAPYYMQVTGKVGPTFATLAGPANILATGNTQEGYLGVHVSVPVVIFGTNQNAPEFRQKLLADFLMAFVPGQGGGQWLIHSGVGIHFLPLSPGS